jgi:glycosyltransferase involved in cell wall biosynthesis
MRIGYEYMLPGAQGTGVEVAIRELLGALVEQLGDNSIHVYARSSKIPPLAGFRNVVVHKASLAALGRPCRILWQQLAAPATLRFARLSLYHATGYALSPYHAIPTVVSMYDVIALDRPDLTRFANALHYGRTIPRGARAAARVIVPSAYVKERLTTITGIPAAKVEVIPLGVSAFFTHARRDEVQRELSRVSNLRGRRYLLAVGRLERKKNLSSLIAAFACVLQKGAEDLALVIVGGIGDDLPKLRRAISGAGVEDSVLLAGRVSEERLVALYNGAEAFVYPSWEEGFGLPPLEAMACGTPVLCSNAGALPETVGNAALLFSPDRPLELASQLSRLLAEPQRAAALKADGLKRASAFTWAACARRVAQVYRAVIDESVGDCTLARERSH